MRENLFFKPCASASSAGSNGLYLNLSQCAELPAQTVHSEPNDVFGSQLRGEPVRHHPSWKPLDSKGSRGSNPSSSSSTKTQSSFGVRETALSLKASDCPALYHGLIPTVWKNTR